MLQGETLDCGQPVAARSRRSEAHVTSNQEWPANGRAAPRALTVPVRRDPAGARRALRVGRASIGGSLAGEAGERADGAGVAGAHETRAAIRIAGTIRRHALAYRCATQAEQVRAA